MPQQTLTLRDLNRTHLQRQHLLNRSHLDVGDMLSALVGLQAQEVKDPYLALWSRIEGFSHPQLGNALQDRSVVRASLMRGTIHLVTAQDYLMLYPATYRLHVRALPSLAFGKQVPPELYIPILASTRAFLTGNPADLKTLADHLEQTYPTIHRRAIGQVGRFLLPLVQIPPRGVWGQSGTARWALASEWLGVPIEEAVGPTDEMIRHYLRAFGPASLTDMTSWSGVTGLKPTVEAMADELVTYRNEADVVLYDLIDMAIAPADMQAPVRFLPGFDNALLGHKDRSRIIADEYRRLIGTPNGMFASTFLVDGFVAGIWRVKDGRMEIAAFSNLSGNQRDEVEQEASRLAPFWTGEDLPITWTEVWKLPGKW